MREIELVTFDINGSLFAIEASNIVSIESNLNVTSTPNSPECVEGIVDYRNNLVTVIDIKDYLYKGTHTITEENKTHIVYIVCHVGDEWMAFEVDNIYHILKVDTEEMIHMNDLLRSFTYMMDGCIVDKDKRIVQILNVSRIYTDIK